MNAIEMNSTRTSRQKAHQHKGRKIVRRRRLRCIDEIGMREQFHGDDNDRRRSILGYIALGCSKQYRWKNRRPVGLACLVYACALSVFMNRATQVAVSAQHSMDEPSTMQFRQQQPPPRKQDLQSKQYSRDNRRGSRNLDSSSGKSGKNGKSSTSKSGKSKSDKSSETTPRPTCHDETSTAPPTCDDHTSTTPPTCDDKTTAPPTCYNQTNTAPPTIMPSTSPTITFSPTLSPVQSPSTIPSITLSSLPSTIPSIMPTTMPSIDGTSVPSTVPTIIPSMIPTSLPSISPSSGPMVQPSSFPSKSLPPSALPSLTATMLPSVYKSSLPSKMPSIAPSAFPTPDVSVVPSSRPSASPSFVPTFTLTELPSNQPSFVPTIETTIDTRQDLKMSLFGLPNALLDTSQQQYYQLRTATYIEDFYNNDDGTNGILEAIKGEITNVTAILTIESQEYEDIGVVEDGVRMIPINYDEDDESYLPEFPVTNYDYHRRHNTNRLLQYQYTTLVTEPCQGTSSLKITFSLELSYRTPDIYQLDSNAVIFFPFSATIFRSNYIDNYLKKPGDEANGTGDASAAFADVTCTSRVVDLADTDSPTYAPTGSPTTASSDTPSVPPSAGESATLIPSQQSVSIVPSTSVPRATILPSSSPSFSSVGPTSGVGSLVPSISTRPPTGENSTGPSTNLPTPKPTVINGSAGPNSSSPSNLNGSNTPTLSQGTLTPANQQPVSVAPSSSVPTVKNTTSATPTVANVPLPTQSPTTPLISPARQMGNSMQLFGLTTSLSQAEKDAWNSRTTQYIISYYNDYEGQGGIRGDIYGVQGYLVITRSDASTKRIADEVLGIARSGNNDPLRVDDEWRYWHGDSDSGKELGARLDFHHVNSRSYDASFDTIENVREDNTEDNIKEQTKSLRKNVVSKPHKGPRKSKPSTGNVRQLQGCGGANVVVVFTIVLRYRNRGATEWTLNEIVNEPFRTWGLRNDYKTNVLKQPGDPAELFAGLSCTGSIIFPPDAQATRFSSLRHDFGTFQNEYMPTTAASDQRHKHPANHHASIETPIEPKSPNAEHSPKSTTKQNKPSSFTETIHTNADDKFIDLRMVNQGTKERKCNSYISAELEEFELTFAYSVESSSLDVYEITDDMENLILDLVASSMLICASESGKHMDGGINESDAVRIRYPEYGETTSIIDCDPLMSSQRKSCAILNTKLLVTSTGVAKSKVHRTILLTLANALNENKFKESIPDISTTYYLGPDPESLTLSATLATSMVGPRGTTVRPMIAISIGCSLLLLVLALFVIRRTSMAAIETIRYSSGGGLEPIPTSEEENDQASVGVSTSLDQVSSPS